MNYPINDIFEGVADLLKEYGTSKDTTFNNYAGIENTYLTYGGYIYLTAYVNGELQSITRHKQEGDNGKN